MDYTSECLVFNAHSSDGISQTGLAQVTHNIRSTLVGMMDEAESLGSLNTNQAAVR